MSRLHDIHQYIDKNQPDALERLAKWLAIPSVSTDPAYGQQILAAAEWIDARLQEIGLASQIMPTNGHPCVVATTPDEDILTDNPDNPPAAHTPHVIFYGHYDVQPPDPIDRWDTGPFQPTITEHAIIARGASDDKGQVAAFIEALAAWKAVAGGWPCKITTIIEGEEEIGSPNLGAFLEENRDRFQGDVIVVSDTAMWDRHTIAITYALRGLVYFDVQLKGPNRDLHSGTFGGCVPNPANELIKILGRLFDQNHRVTIPGFYDDVAQLDDDERQRWNQLGFDEARFLQSVGLSRGAGEQGYALLERRWARPSCDINGLYGGYGGAGAKTIIPASAGAKVSFRLAAHQDPRKIADSFEAWLRDQPTPGLEWRITRHGQAAPVMAATDTPWADAAQQACKNASGRPAVLVRDGATIPVIAEFKRVLGLDSLLLGFGQHDDRIHSPNEKFDLAGFTLGMKTHAALLQTLANAPRT